MRKPQRRTPGYWTRASLDDVAKGSVARRPSRRRAATRGGATMARQHRLTVLGVLCFILAACGASSASPTEAGASPATVPATPVAAATQPPTPTPAPTVAVAAPCTTRPLKFDPKKFDLTGAWRGSDNGIYYLRQLGKALWWNGRSGKAGPPAQLGREWNNVASGQIKDDLTIALDWADVPRGQILGGGTLVWKIQDDGTGNIKLTKVSETGSG